MDSPSQYLKRGNLADRHLENDCLDPSLGIAVVLFFALKKINKKSEFGPNPAAEAHSEVQKYEKFPIAQYLTTSPSHPDPNMA